MYHTSVVSLSTSGSLTTKRKPKTHLPLPDPFSFPSLPRWRSTCHLRRVLLYVRLRQRCALFLMCLEVRLLTVAVAVAHAVTFEALLEGVRCRGTLGARCR